MHLKVCKFVKKNTYIYIYIIKKIYKKHMQFRLQQFLSCLYTIFKPLTVIYCVQHKLNDYMIFLSILKLLMKSLQRMRKGIYIYIYILADLYPALYVFKRFFVCFPSNLLAHSLPGLVKIFFFEISFLKT